MFHTGRHARRSQATSGGRSFVGQVTPNAWIVCELSSFGLEDVHTLEPRVGVLPTSRPIADRHDAKLRMFERQTTTRRWCRSRRDPGSASKSISPRTTSCRPSRAFPGHTTARTPSPPPSRRARLGSTMRRSRGTRRLRGRRAPRWRTVRELRGHSLCQRLEGHEDVTAERAARIVSGIPPPALSSGGRASTSPTSLSARALGPGDVASLDIGEGGGGDRAVTRRRRLAVHRLRHARRGQRRCGLESARPETSLRLSRRARASTNSATSRTAQRNRCLPRAGLGTE